MIIKFLKNWFIPKRQLTKLTEDYSILWEAHKDLIKANARLSIENRKLLEEEINGKE